MICTNLSLYDSLILKWQLDLVDHHILLDKLKFLEVHACLLRWIASFLEGRSQVVKIATSSSPPHKLNGGIPQGMRLGPMLFAVKVNDLVRRWLPRAKFVDYLTVLEIIPRNVPSILPYIVSEVQAYAVNNNMCLTVTPQNVRSWRLTFAIIIVSNALLLLRAAVFWRRSSRFNFLEFLYPTT